MGRRERVELLVEHFKNPRHAGVLEDADVVMPGGSPECGGSVVVYLKGGEDGRIEDLSFTGQGDTISMGATSILLQRVHAEKLGMDEVLSLDYNDLIESLGRDVIGSRTLNATLGLRTLQFAVRKYRQDHRRNGLKRPPTEAV